MFPDQPALAAGSVLLLSGESGSGKSTLLRVLAGLLRPTSGQVDVQGHDPYLVSAARRDDWRGRTIGFMPQHLRLLSAFTVWEQVAMPFVCSGIPVDGEAVHKVLDALALRGLADQSTATLSGGQAQRVALARALVRQPAIVLVDEPTANLDDRQAHAVVDLLMTHAPTAVRVIATHDARVVHLLQTQPHLQRLHLPARWDDLA